MDKLYVIKIGGEVVDDRERLRVFIKEFNSISEKKILVHGGGKLATQVADAMGVPQKMVDGRRVTDKETLRIVTMVYAGLVNKEVVALLQSEGTNAVGLSGVDGNLLLAHKRTGEFDFGYVGDIDKVNTKYFKSLIESGITPVIAPITHDGKGQLLNTNADTIARKIAESLSSDFEVHMVYSFGKAGVLRNAEDDATLIPRLRSSEYRSLKEENLIYAGMIPKLDNAFGSLLGGVKSVAIGKASDLRKIINGETGTLIENG